MASKTRTDSPALRDAVNEMGDKLQALDSALIECDAVADDDHLVAAHIALNGAYERFRNALDAK